MYTNDYGEKILIDISEHDLLSTDTKAYSEITKIINPFDLNITKNNPYNDEEKNKSCFLSIETEFDNILVILKTDKIPNINQYYDMYYDYINDCFPNLVSNGILNFHLLNDDNQLVLMYGTSIIILDINTFEVLKYVSSSSIKNFGIKLTYENGIYSVKDETDNLTYFDKNLNFLNKKQ